MENEKRIFSLAISYYSRQDIQKAILDFCRKRETVSRSFETFGKRPDTIEFPSDILQQVRKGFSSFHCSEEIWTEPLQLSTGLTPEQLNELREGWDLLIDIDSKYFDYSKIAAELIIEALKFHGIKNFGLKFSGGKGFHIIVPWKAFPKKAREQETRKMFPEWPRIISMYLTELIKKKLIDRITELTEGKNYVKDFEAPKQVMPDLILVSSRHLFRAPYSLHEKGFVSVVLDEGELKNFQPKMADPLRITIKNFYPDAKESEARELLISALDWFKEREKEEKKTEYPKKFQEVKIDKSKIVYPPCISNIMKGMADGKKRALFILINYFKSLGMDIEEVEEKLDEWNQKNNPPLKQGYIISQISWHKRNKTMLPPNCNRDYYKGLGICEKDSLCAKIKNPVNYSVRKAMKK